MCMQILHANTVYMQISNTNFFNPCNYLDEETWIKTFKWQAQGHTAGKWQHDIPYVLKSRSMYIGYCNHWVYCIV